MKSAHKLYIVRESHQSREGGGLKTLDSPVAEQVKPIAAKATKTAHKLINGFSFDPHPRRTKIILVAKFAIPAMIAGVLAGRSARTS